MRTARAGATTGSHGSVIGYCLSLYANGTWTLGGLAGGRGPPTAHAWGRLAPSAGPVAGVWHSMCLNVSRADRVVAVVDRATVADVADFGRFVPATPDANTTVGLVALGSAGGGPASGQDSACPPR